MTQRSQDDLLRGLLLMLTHNRSQRLPGSNFQENPRFSLQDLHQSIREAHRLPHVTYPVFRIYRLLRRDPGPSHVGNVGHLRHVALYLAHECAEVAKDGFHHRGVEGVRGLQMLGLDPLLDTTTLEFIDQFVRAGCHAHGRCIDRCDRGPRGQEGARLCL